MLNRYLRLPSLSFLALIVVYKLWFLRRLFRGTFMMIIVFRFKLKAMLRLILMVILRFILFFFIVLVTLYKIFEIKGLRLIINHNTFPLFPFIVWLMFLVKKIIWIGIKVRIEGVFVFVFFHYSHLYYCLLSLFFYDFSNLLNHTNY